MNQIKEIIIVFDPLKETPMDLPQSDVCIYCFEKMKFNDGYFICRKCIVKI